MKIRLFSFSNFLSKSFYKIGQSLLLINNPFFSFSQETFCA